MLSVGVCVCNIYIFSLPLNKKKKKKEYGFLLYISAQAFLQIWWKDHAVENLVVESRD